MSLLNCTLQANVILFLLISNKTRVSHWCTLCFFQRGSYGNAPLSPKVAWTCVSVQTTMCYVKFWFNQILLNDCVQSNNCVSASFWRYCMNRILLSQNISSSKPEIRRGEEPDMNEIVTFISSPIMMLIEVWRITRIINKKRKTRQRKNGRLNTGGCCGSNTLLYVCGAPNTFLCQCFEK